MQLQCSQCWLLNDAEREEGSVEEEPGQAMRSRTRQGVIQGGEYTWVGSDKVVLQCIGKAQLDGVANVIG